MPDTQTESSEAQLSAMLSTLDAEAKSDLISVIFYLLAPELYEMPESYKEFLEWQEKEHKGDRKQCKQ